METSTTQYIDLGNLAVGIGTFTLAVVLGIINIIATRKSSKIHIADKRQEWVSNFRKQVSKILALQLQFDLIIKDCSVEELDKLLMELNLVSYEIRFMLAPTDKRGDDLEDIFAEIFTDLKNRRSENFSKKQYQVIKITDSIINEQRKKIVNLDNSNPIL
jgi:hypothetical protein